LIYENRLEVDGRVQISPITL